MTERAFGFPIPGAPQAQAQATPSPTTSRPTSAAQAQAGSDDYYDPGDAFIGSCPECSSDLMFAEGCVKCLRCGYSECG